MITTHHIFVVTNRHDIQTLTWIQRQLPLILGHASHNIVRCKTPVFSDVTIFYPDICIIGRERRQHHRILYKDRRMWLAVVVHNESLVGHHILEFHGRGDHLARRTKMIEGTTRQGHDGHRKTAQLRVVNQRIRAQRATKLIIEIIRLQLRLIGPTAFHEQTDSTVAENPYADIRQVIMLLLKFLQFLNTGLLEHLLQHLRRATVGHKDAMILGHAGIQPQTITHHVCLRHRRQGLSGGDEHIATNNHGIQAVGRLRHHLFIERQLQGQEILRQTLSPLPSEHRDGREYLARRGIGRQATTLPASMQEDAFLASQPRVERVGGLRTPGLHQQPGRASATTNAMSLRVAGTEKLAGWQTRNLMKDRLAIGTLPNQIRRQR